MKTEIISTKSEDVKDKLLVIPLYEEELQDTIKNPKSRFESLLKELISDTGFKAEHMQLHFLNTPIEIKTKRVLLAGLGKISEIDLERIRKLFGAVLNKIKDGKITSFTTNLPNKGNNLSLDGIATSVIEGIELADYSFDKYKTEKKDYQGIEKYSIIIQAKPEEAKKILTNTKTICDNVKFVRDLVNESGSNLTPIKLVKHAEKISKDAKLKCTVINEKQMESLGLNLILNVAKSGNYPPRLVILEYKGDGASKENVMLVGKGITFDSGGLDLKPALGMENMKMDMAGAGAVLGIMKSVAELKIKKNIIGVIPTCENLIGTKAYKPGDIITSYSKLNVEILNTDAEGRLVLGDAIAYGIEKYKPKFVIDLATLTGACLIVFGEYVAGLIANDDKLANSLFSAGEKTYERVWQLPLYEEYKEMVKSEIADIKNIGHKQGYAGTITGAAFISKFVGNTPWAHLDIAGTAWSESEREYIPKGGTGFGVRLITKLLEE